MRFLCYNDITYKNNNDKHIIYNKNNDKYIIYRRQGAGMCTQCSEDDNHMVELPPLLTRYYHMPTKITKQ